MIIIGEKISEDAENLDTEVAEPEGMTFFASVVSKTCLKNRHLASETQSSIGRRR